MKAVMLTVALRAAALGARAHAADQSDVKSTFDKFQSVRPQAPDLAPYQLDWMPTLKAARDKAAREGRPIFLVVVTNSFGDMYSGHC